jgi:hypothetical protein
MMVRQKLRVQYIECPKWGVGSTGQRNTGAVGPVGARSGDRENCKCNMAKRQSTFPASQTTTENSPPGKSAKTCPALLAKICRLTRRANHLYKLAPSHPRKGRIASRHERAVGCDGRDSVGRAMGSQGGSSRERSDGARTNDAANRLCQNSPDGTRSGKTFGADGRGRRSRVVLAPRCWRQVLRRCIRPNRVGDGSSIRKATVANKPVTGESPK